MFVAADLLECVFADQSCREQARRVLERRWAEKFPGAVAHESTAPATDVKWRNPMIVMELRGG